MTQTKSSKRCDVLCLLLMSCLGASVHCFVRCIAEKRYDAFVPAMRASRNAHLESPKERCHFVISCFASWRYVFGLFLCGAINPPVSLKQTPLSCHKAIGFYQVQLEKKAPDDYGPPQKEGSSSQRPIPTAETHR